MKHKNGFLRAIISETWQVETKANHFMYRSSSKSGQINYYDIHSVRRNSGIVSDEIMINANNRLLKITGFSEIGASGLNHLN